MTKQEKLKIYQETKEVIENLKDGDYVWLGNVPDQIITVERDDMVEFQPTYIVDDYIMSSVPEIVALVTRQLIK